MTGYTATYIKVTGVELFYDGRGGFTSNLANAEAFALEADADAFIVHLSAANPNISLDKTQKMVPGSDERDAPMGDDDGPRAGEGTSADTATTNTETKDDGFPSDSEGGEDDPKGFAADPDAPVVDPKGHEDGFPSDSEGGEDDPGRVPGENRDC